MCFDGVAAMINRVSKKSLINEEEEPK